MYMHVDKYYGGSYMNIFIYLYGCNVLGMFVPTIYQSRYEYQICGILSSKY